MPGPVSCTAIVKCAVDGLDANLDRAGIGELDRIADEIQKHLVRRRSSPRPAGRPGGTDDLISMPFFCASEPVEATTVSTIAFERIIVERQGELTGFDLGNVEHVIDQTQQMLSV